MFNSKFSPPMLFYFNFLVLPEGLNKIVMLKYKIYLDILLTIISKVLLIVTQWKVLFLNLYNSY